MFVRSPTRHRLATQAAYAVSIRSRMCSTRHIVGADDTSEEYASGSQAFERLSLRFAGLDKIFVREQDARRDAEVQAEPGSHSVLEGADHQLRAQVSGGCCR
ncbi:hypothetical protein BCEP27_160031 [Burkholderia cepacia]